MPEPVYLDHAATTPVREEVLAAMLPFFGPRFGNPSSVHRWGREARTALDEARERVGRCLGASADEIVFTSCGTEADNMALIGVWRARRGEGRHAAVSTPIEHKAVLGALHQIGKEGGEERLLAVDPSGRVTDASAESLVRDDAAVCSVMWVNNEIGTVQPIAELAAAAKAHGAWFHTDAVQAFGKVPVNLASLACTLATISGHKIGAPKGIGALIVRDRKAIEAIIHGGGQQYGLRPGTENVAGAVALGRAAALAAAEQEGEAERLGALRDDLAARLRAVVPDLVVNGEGAERAPHVLSIAVPGADSEALLMHLDLAGVAASSGSACSTGAVEPSHVLVAMGVPRDLALAAIRLSLGHGSTADDVARTAEVMPMVVAKVRKLAGVLGRA
jgi:cysteine desulfurase